MDKPSKKRPAQHRTETDGLKLFEQSLPNSKEASFVFTRGQNDYGIDGEVQIILNELHTGEFYKVQIKATISPEYKAGGKMLGYSLDIASAYFLIEEVKSPTALIVVDTKSSEVFWHPIQTDSDARKAMDENLDSASIRIDIDVQNELRPDNFQSFYQYLKDAQSLLSRREVLATKTNDTLGTGMKFLSEIEEQTLSLEGFTPITKNQNDPSEPGLMFSVGYGKDKRIDYVPSDSFRPELAPRIELKAKFSVKTDEGRRKADAFQRLVEKNEGSIDLTDENIDSFRVVSGNTVIDDKAYAEGGVQLSIRPSVERRRISIYINNGEEELENTVETWFDDGKVHMESISDQALHLTSSFEPNESGGSASFKLHINNQLFKNAKHDLRMMNFFKGKREVAFYLVDQDGFKRKIFGGQFDGSEMVKEDMYQFIKAITEIEDKTCVPIFYPLPDSFTRKDIDGVFWVHRLLTRGKIIKDVTFNFSLQEDPPEDLIEGGAVMMTQSPPEIYLFGKPYVLPTLKQDVRGVIKKLETKSKNGKISYKAFVPNAEFTIDKA